MTKYLMPCDNVAQPKVSILIPTYNREKFLLGAVRSALMQTHSDIEVLVGINACTDGSELLVRSIQDARLKIIVRPVLKTMYENFNLLIGEATGDFVLILSDDDELLPDAITNLLVAMEHSQTRMAIGATKVVMNGRAVAAPTFHVTEYRTDWLALVQSYLDFRFAIYPCATLLPRKELLSIGGYNDSTYHFAADTAMWMQLAQRLGYVALCHRVVANYAVHDDNETVVSSQSKWLSALDGIGIVVNGLPYSSEHQRERMLRVFQTYRARAIVRTQSDAVGRSGLSFRTLLASGRLVFRETTLLPSHQRGLLLSRWILRCGLQTLRSLLKSSKSF